MLYAILQAYFNFINQDLDAYEVLMHTILMWAFHEVCS